MSELTDKMNALNKDREPVIPEPLFIAGDAMCTATCGLFNDVTGRCNSGHDGIEKIEANGMRHTPCTFFGAQGVVTPEMPPTDTERLVEVAKENYMQAKAELDAHAHQGFVALATKACLHLRGTLTMPPCVSG